MNGIKRSQLMLGFLLLMIFLLNTSIVTGAENTAEKNSTKQAGKTLLTRGSVMSKRASGNVTLKRRSAIFEKDEIHVGSDGRAQFRMIDQALISIQENSVLQIKNYQYKKGGKNNSALMELLSGGLRTITGAIGKGNKKAYELRTPLATIGIRGTDYEVEIVPSGMYVAVWDGVIHLRARLKNGCNMLIGRSQPYMFIFIDRLGQCKGLPNVPDVFATGHSSNIAPPQKRQSVAARVAGVKSLLLEPLTQDTPTLIATASTPPLTTPPITTHNFSSFTVDQSNPSVELSSKANTIGISNPTFKVGLDLYDNNVAGGTVSNYQTNVGGYPVTWGHWAEFSSPANPSSTNLDGLIWAVYTPSGPTEVPSAGTFTYSNSQDITTSSLGAVSNLNIQMDVNFATNAVTNGLLEAFTPNDKWVAVFDGAIDANSRDLDLQLNGASVIDSNPSTASPPRDASGFISGDFVGSNAEAVIGSFGLSEDTAPANHIEGVFIAE